MDDDYIKRTLQAYNAHPEKYETATIGMTPLEELETFVKLIPTTDYPLLDAGCAFGRDTTILTELGFKAIGIDMSDGLLYRAKILYPNIEFKKMDVRKLSLNDESIAGIWCHATLLHLKDNDIATALSEFHRVLIPGGVMFVSFKEGSGDEEFVEKFSSDSARYFNYQSKETVSNIVTESNFTIEHIYTINERKKWGADKRDLNWVYCFAKKV